MVETSIRSTTLPRTTANESGLRLLGERLRLEAAMVRLSIEGDLWLELRSVLIARTRPVQHIAKWLKQNNRALFVF
jgi:hypothetical protein